MAPTPRLLDESLEWPRELWQRGGAWRLGHGMCVLGPGWWPLVRQAFAAVAETPGAVVVDVRQKCAVLEVRLAHLDPGTQARLDALAASLTRASRERCEACGAAVPPVTPLRAPWRNHCPACHARYAALAGGGRSERRLWEERAGRAWPPFEGW